MRGSRRGLPDGARLAGSRGPATPRRSARPGWRPLINPLHMPMRKQLPAWLLLVLLTFVAGLAAAAGQGESAPPAAAKVPLATAPLAAPLEAPAVERSDELEDPIEPFVPKHARSSRDEDRVRAHALFAAARVAEQKQDYALALRSYERAYRFDPAAVSALREIVPLAFNLDRQAEAVRYALVLAEHDPSDLLLLRRLAINLSEDGDTQRALRLYEKAFDLARRNGEKPNSGAVLMWMEMGRLYFLEKQYSKAAERFDEVGKALAAPQDYGLDATMQKALLNKAELTYQLFGEVFLEADRPADALAAFEKAQAIKPDEALHLYNLARVDARQKQPAQALAKLENYFDKHYSSQGTGPYQLLGQVLESLGQQGQIVERLAKLRAADPDNMPLAYELAQRYRQSGQLEAAEPIYRSLVERQKNRPPAEAVAALVDIYRRQKNAARVLDMLGATAERRGAALGEAKTPLADDPEMTRAVVAEARRRLDAEPAKLTYGARLAAATLAVEQKDFVAANALFDAALKADKGKPAEALVTWGLELFGAAQYADAVKVFERGLEEKLVPADNAPVYFYLSGALEMSGRTEEALEAARKAGELQKDSPRFAGRVAWIQYHAKRYESARQSYQELVDRFDKQYDSEEARDVMHEARLILSNIAATEGKVDESEEWVEQVLDEFPEDVGAMNDLGYLWADSGKHLDRALEMIQAAVAREPKNIAYRDSLGWVLFRLGRYNEAIAELKAAAAAEEPDGTILDHLAEAQLKAGDAPAAIDTWSRAITAFEKRSEADKVSETREKIAQARALPPQK